MTYSTPSGLVVGYGCSLLLFNPFGVVGVAALLLLFNPFGVVGVAALLLLFNPFRGCKKRC